MSTFTAICGIAPGGSSAPPIPDFTNAVLLFGLAGFVAAYQNAGAIIQAAGDTTSANVATTTSSPYPLDYAALAAVGANPKAVRLYNQTGGSPTRMEQDTDAAWRPAITGIAESRVVRVTQDGALANGVVVTIGGAIGTVGDEIAEAPNIDDIQSWAVNNLSSMPALSVGVAVGSGTTSGYFDITFNAGAAANDLICSSTDANLTFTDLPTNPLTASVFVGGVEYTVRGYDSETGYIFYNRVEYPTTDPPLDSPAYCVYADNGNNWFVAAAANVIVGTSALWADYPYLAGTFSGDLPDFTVTVAPAGMDAGPANGALVFDGTNDYMQSNANVDLSAETQITFWWYGNLADLGEYNPIYQTGLLYDSESTGSFGLYQQAAQIWVGQLNSIGEQNQKSRTISDNANHLIVSTIDNNLVGVAQVVAYYDDAVTSGWVNQYNGDGDTFAAAPAQLGGNGTSFGAIGTVAGGIETGVRDAAWVSGLYAWLQYVEAA